MNAKTNYVISLMVIGIALAVACVAAPALIMTPPTVVVSTPAVTVAAPAPVVVAPDCYTWDGYEYVGIVGGQYYYLGPGNVWMLMDPMRLHRFQTWQGGHADWQKHATHNVLYRNTRPSQPHPLPASAPAHDQPLHNDASQHPNPGHYPPQ